MQKTDLTPGFAAFLLMASVLLDGTQLTAFFLAAAAHELAHLLSAVWMGGHVQSVRFRFGGAVMHLSGLSCRRELLCALAGPAVNFLCVPLGRFFPDFGAFSLLLGAYNALPLYPLDGGRALYLLLRQTGMASPERVSRCLSVCTLTALLAAGFWGTWTRKLGLWPLLLAAGIALRQIFCCISDAEAVNYI